MTGSNTIELLERWHSGDQQALDLLIKRHLSWIVGQVEHKMGDLLRSKGEALDYVQDALLQFLIYAPPFVIHSGADFRSLLLRIAQNSLNSRYREFTAARRNVARERPLPPDTLLNLDPPQKSVGTPSASVDRREKTAWIMLGVEFLAPEERDIIVLHKWDKRTFAEIGAELGLSESGARKRYNAAMKRLGAKVWALRTGGVARALAEEAQPGGKGS